MRLVAVAIVALATGVEAQFLNRAVWLGDQAEGLVRDYEQGVEYFMDRLSYVVLPPWWNAGPLDPFANELLATGGSVSTTELTVEVNGRFGIDVGDGFVARLDYLQSEHQTARFQRIGFGLDKRISESTALFFQLEGTPDKSRADISFGSEFLRSEHQAHRLMLTLVDFASRKSDEFDYETAPYGLLAAGFLGHDGGLALAYEIGAQLPFAQKTTDIGQRFRMHRMINRLEARLPLGRDDRLVAAYQGEWTVKSLDSATPSTDEDYDVQFHQLRGEWWRALSPGTDLSFGAYWLRLTEDGVRPNAGESFFRDDRNELMAIARARLPLGGAWSAEPYLFAGYVDKDQWVEGDGPGTEAFAGFQGKLGAPIVYAFSPRASMRVDLSFQLDEAAFAGGGVQFRATF